MEETLKPNPYDRILDKAVYKNIPFLMQFELTSRCNLKCVHCYNVPEEDKKELSTKKIKSILDELSDEGALFMGFTGGEILLREDFFEIAGYARKKGFALRLYTNATMISHDIADKIRDIEPLTVEISLYAANPDIHDKITGVPGSYNKTICAISMLRKKGLNIVIKDVIMKENAREYDRLAALVDDIGARVVYDYVIFPRTNGSKQPLTHCMGDFEIKDLLCKNVKAGAVSEENLIKLDELPDKSQPICGAARNGACISPSGDVFPCVTWRVSLGNLKEKGFKEIWNSAKAKEVRELTIGDMRHCSQCRLFYHCIHCPGIALLETGDYLGLSPAACRAARLKKEAIETAHSSWLIAHSA